MNNEEEKKELEETPIIEEEPQESGQFRVPWGWAIAMGVIALLMIACFIVILSVR